MASDDSSSPPPGPARGIRWWPAGCLLVLAAVATTVIRLREDFPFQRRNLISLGIILGAAAALLLWWIFASRASWRRRFAVLGIGVLLLAGVAAAFRLRGVTGDLVPVFELRWARPAAAGGTATSLTAVSPGASPAAIAYPQFLGPDRTGILRGPALDPDWRAHPPVELWRQPVGAGWSGFVVTGDLAVTQEQDGANETVTARDLATGRVRWRHGDPARYDNTIAGEGPRATPTIVGDRVYSLGSRGHLNCLELNSGRLIWSRELCTEARVKVPEWGFSGSPLVEHGLVVVSAGGQPNLSLLAFDATNGTRRWSGGDAPAGYSSPTPVTLSGVRQIVSFNSKRISAHDPGSGRVLWEYPWGLGLPHVAVPLVTGTNRILFSSGYGVGSELLEVRNSGGKWTVTRLWQSIRMKAKFANLVQRDGFVYGLDDGMLAAMDLRDGSQKWKEGRHGHGQGLLINDLFLLMAEGGDLVLLRPTPSGPAELARHRVFQRKTWNPIALAGDRLLVRNDQEAVCLRLPLAPGLPVGPGIPGK